MGRNHVRRSLPSAQQIEDRTKTRISAMMGSARHVTATHLWFFRIAHIRPHSSHLPTAFSFSSLPSHIQLWDFGVGSSLTSGPSDWIGFTSASRVSGLGQYLLKKESEYIFQPRFTEIFSDSASLPRFLSPTPVLGNSTLKPTALGLHGPQPKVCAVKDVWNSTWQIHGLHTLSSTLNNKSFMRKTCGKAVFVNAMNEDGYPRSSRRQF